jgi:hypothetical protein
VAFFFRALPQAFQHDRLTNPGEEWYTFGPMELLCYACAQPPEERRSTIAKVDKKFEDSCWGTCKNCGLIICAEHGFRNGLAKEYQCVYCVGPGMRKFRPKGITPDDPTSPPGDLEEFTDAYSRIKVEVIEPVKQAIIGYLDENGLPHNTPLDDEALSRAAAAFEMATGGVRERVIAGLTEV